MNKTAKQVQKSSGKYWPFLVAGLAFLVVVAWLSYLTDQARGSGRLSESSLLVDLLQVIAIASYASATYLVYKIARSKWHLSTSHAAAMVAAFVLAFIGLVIYGPTPVYVLAVGAIAAIWALLILSRRR